LDNRDSPTQDNKYQQDNRINRIAENQIDHTGAKEQKENGL
jgi:hypothetical protein